MSTQIKILNKGLTIMPHEAYHFLCKMIENKSLFLFQSRETVLCDMSFIYGDFKYPFHDAHGCIFLISRGQGAEFGNH